MAHSRLAAFKAQVEALVGGEDKTGNAALTRALQKKEIRRCAKAWDTFTRNCDADQQRPAMRQIPPPESLPPVA